MIRIPAVAAGGGGGGGGASSWDTITAAAASATTANGAFNIVYNTAPTADSKIAWTFGETSAATNGTSTSGVPNQYLVKFATLASSTQSAAGFYSRGNHVFSISPTTTQILAGAGTQAAPIFSCTGLTGSGLWFEPGNSAVALGVENVKYIYMNGSQIQIAPAGSVSSPPFTDYTNGTTGCFWGSHFMAIVDSTSHEIMRFVGGTASVPYTTRQACAFANLPAAANGSEIYCSDCDPAALINTACASAGAKTGSMAARINGQWICYT